MSSVPNWVLMKSSKEEMLAESSKSSWWKIISEYPAELSLSTASLMPLYTSLAVNITLTPFEASCLDIANPNPLLAPVTSAILYEKVCNKLIQKQWEDWVSIKDSTSIYIMLIFN